MYTIKNEFNSTYKFCSFEIYIEIYFSEKQKSIIKMFQNISEYETLFTYSKFLGLKKDTYLYPINDIEKLTCIFCHKTSDEVKFSKRPHVIPELLDNHYLLHYEECDDCNLHFGITLETELDNFLKPYRTLNLSKTSSKKFVKTTSINQKEVFVFNKVENNFQIISSIENAQFDESKNSLTLKLDLLKHRPSDVYKAFMKILFGLLPRNHLEHFEKLRKWIINKDTNFKLYSPLNIIKTRLDGFQAIKLQIRIFYKPSTSIDEFKILKPKAEKFEYIAIIMFGSIVFEIPLMSDLCFEKLDFMRSVNENFTFTFPVIPKPGLPNKYDILDLSETNKVTGKENIYFEYSSRTEQEIN